MCGICILLSLSLNEQDKQIIKSIQHNNEAFDDKDKNQEDSKIIQAKESKEIVLDANISELINAIHQRGPDFLNVIEYNPSLPFNQCMIDSNHIDKAYNDVFAYLQSNSSILMISAVLNLRGIDHITKQPISQSPYDSTLLYNGELYSINGSIIGNDYDLCKDNDGLILYKLLNDALLQEDLPKDDYASKFFKVVNQLESDHAFIYIDKKHQLIFINRDLFGKRSLLLVYIISKGILILTSVLSEELYKNRDSDDILICEIPNNCLLMIDISDLNKQTDTSNDKQRLFMYPNKTISSPSQLRFNESISPINQYVNLTKQCYDLLSKAVNKRICNFPEIAQYIFTTSSSITLSNPQASIGVLFSGGIDSLLLAYFTIINSPPHITIDLFNLSFDKQNAPDRNSGIIAYSELLTLFPSRLINLILIDKSFNENVESIKERVLCLIYPRETHMDFNIATALKYGTKKQGYKVIPSKLQEYFKANNLTITSLDSIHKDNYNNNIISKQIGKINYESFIDKDSLYTSSAKIILSGLGADEFFGGYSRYKNGDLIQHMTKDIDRIWLRNFGRDDRSCSDNGIELRFPFFDYALINFLRSIKDMKEVTNFEMKRGIGEKRLLRNVAKMIGFDISYQFEKRAIQFGTKLAHETNISKYGSNNKANGKAQFKLNK